MTELEQLVLDVARNNPGAITVIKELLWFTKWFDMMNWCKDNLNGSALWEKYKDEFHYDSTKLGYWIQDKMSQKT